jgi:type IV pilus assembly protein PilQ
MKSINSKSLLIFIITIFVIICLNFAIAMAQEAADANNVKIVEASGGGDQLSELDIRMQKTVSIDVSDVPIDMVIRQLSEQVNVDFIISPKVAESGNVTVTLTDVSVEEALQSILDVRDSSFIKGKNVVKILTREEMSKISDTLVTQTFEIIYADVEQVVDALQKFLSNQGKVSFIKGTSYLIVTDTEPKVREIARLIEKIDRITPQVLVEVRIYDITSKDNLDLGIDWYASRRTNFSSGNFSDSDIEINKDGTDTYLNSYTDPAVIGTFSGGTNKTADATMGYLRLGILNKHFDIDAQLRAEKENIEAKLLANPRIRVIDNQKALFEIVTENPYVERTINGSNITETVKFKNVGTKLEVTPQVARDGKIRLHIIPEFGIVVGSVQVSTSTVPIVDTRKVDTTALVDDGEAVVLGGLRKKDTTKQVNKVPLLGDLPVIGNLFRFEGETTTVAELVVFITPKIITDSNLTDDEQNALDTTQFNGPVPVSTRAEKAGLGK